MVHSGKHRLRRSGDKSPTLASCDLGVPNATYLIKVKINQNWTPRPSQQHLANQILHSRNILFPKDHAAIKDVADNIDWGELVAPPAEGEMTQTDSAAEQPTKPTGTGGAHVPAMRTNPSAVTTQSIQAINALTPGSGDGIQTRSWNPNAPAISLARERGGVKISIDDTTPSELEDIFAGSSDTNSSKSNDHHTFSLLTNTSSVLSAPTIPTLADKFGCLQLSDYTPTKPDSPLATTGHLEQSWAALANPSNPNNHPTMEEALAGPQANEWLEAMRKEVSTLKRMGTYKHVEPPKDCKPIGNKWVLTLKRNANGEPECYKAQLVAQGFSQQPGIDFDKMFAPVVHLDLICSLASLANNNNWDICQLDVNAAYLHAEVDKELYMQQIPYFKDGTNCVLMLKHSIYGLKQARCMWNKLYNTKLQSIGYRPCLTYLCVYYRLEDYKGIAFKRNRKRGILCLNQTTYINNLVHFAGLKDAFPTNTPLSPSIQLTRFDGAKPKFNYGTYIDPENPKEATSLLSLEIGKSSNTDSAQHQSLNLFSPNLQHHKSISGHVFMLGGAAVSWSAKKQATVALSTMEAKYMALLHACTQALWMQQFFEELYLYTDSPTLILSDNLAALTLSIESQFHGQSKHINIQHHFMHNIIEKQKVTTLYVPSNKNPADAFTKALLAPQFRYLMRSIMGKPIKEPIKDKLIN
ncbi:Retrovirus-related Pol polyprotein from transposon TNT 1-94 [Rhizoctonia solani]|uniref:Retrovirus-related Pol polyprotein from transposon TNT 1-94 n=1 Tax=Rhizoctonia solani TaxID=456999 RepID=A0A8H8P7G3_9AGAM|nr:Retrovirus-related Pol polyprotein from transposon TNT 1-94 [Rhizoctonia solani]QRW26680.1 Retrovirus-related Pol polyprotein from transposon TNT 1-94 [Rhizoctonia solani]